jgi:hypothetical protein
MGKRFIMGAALAMWAVLILEYAGLWEWIAWKIFLGM